MRARLPAPLRRRVRAVCRSFTQARLLLAAAVRLALPGHERRNRARRRLGLHLLRGQADVLRFESEGITWTVPVTDRVISQSSSRPEATTDERSSHSWLARGPRLPSRREHGDRGRRCKHRNVVLSARQGSAVTRRGHEVAEMTITGRFGVFYSACVGQMVIVITCARLGRPTAATTKAATSSGWIKACWS